jgi:ribosomal-protein-alanine N-acetyltransferase
MIRTATPDDIPAMRRLAADAATAGQWTETQYENIFEPVPRRVVLVIENQGVAEGFLVAAATGAEWEIENLAVGGPARRRGLATALLKHFLDWARQQGTESVLLEVRESNVAARVLYEKAGFVQSGRRLRYYTAPAEDAILYRLSFPKAEQH